MPNMRMCSVIYKLEAFGVSSSCCGTLNTNINTLGFHVFVKQEVELNIPEVPTGFKVLCVAWGRTDSHLLRCSI